MSLKKPSGAFVLVVALSLAPACGGDLPDTSDPEADGAPEQRAGQDTASTTAGAAASPTAVALPGLFGIMMGLQADMARVSRGLWMEDMDSVAMGAEAVADHPRVPPEEFERISAVLGGDMSSFGGMDMQVHDLAVRLAEEAREGDLDAVLGTDAELRSACVACHSEFRERLREGLISGAP